MEVADRACDRGHRMSVILLARPDSANLLVVPLLIVSVRLATAYGLTSNARR
jgi:hypothetical protein